MMDNELIGERDSKLCKFCKKEFSPKVEWQKFCSIKCHNAYWRQVYREKSAFNKRLEILEKQVEKLKNKALP